MAERIYYRKEKLRGATWEYEVHGGWLTLPAGGGQRQILHHRFDFYRPRVVEVRTFDGPRRIQRAGADQWFFPDRWFSLLRFYAPDDTTVGYYVNFSLPLAEVRTNYYRDVDLELDLWIDPDGTTTELDRDEFDGEIAQQRMASEWVESVLSALHAVNAAVERCVDRRGGTLDSGRRSNQGVPAFILHA